jgi:hypothetical protein
MNTTTEHKAVKIYSSKDGWGMSHATWEYRGVTLAYTQRTTTRSPWAVIADSDTGWFRITAKNKAEMMTEVDEWMSRGWVASNNGRLSSN